MKGHLPKLVNDSEILFTMHWSMKYPSGVLKFDRAHYDPKDLSTVVEDIDGVGFMNNMVISFRAAAHLELPRTPSQ